MIPESLRLRAATLPQGIAGSPCMVEMSTEASCGGSWVMVDLLLPVCWWLEIEHWHYFTYGWCITLISVFIFSEPSPRWVSVAVSLSYEDIVRFGVVLQYHLTLILFCCNVTNSHFSKKLYNLPIKMNFRPHVCGQASLG